MTQIAAGSGFEGREERLGHAVSLAIRTLKDAMPYQHEMNDALVKMHLNSLQFAKNKGLLREYVAHDVQTMQPTLQSLRAEIERTGEREIALSGLFERTAGFYQLCLDVEASPGRRSFTFPFSHVLAVARKIGQFDLTDEEIHEQWLRPRLRAYAAALGVDFEVSDIDAAGKVHVSLR